MVKIGKTTKDQYFSYTTHTDNSNFLVQVVGNMEVWYGPFPTAYQAQHFIEETKAKQ